MWLCDFWNPFKSKDYIYNSQSKILSLSISIWGTLIQTTQSLWSNPGSSTLQQDDSPPIPSPKRTYHVVTLSVTKPRAEKVSQQGSITIWFGDFQIEWFLLSFALYSPFLTWEALFLQYILIHAATSSWELTPNKSPGCTCLIDLI